MRYLVVAIAACSGAPQAQPIAHHATRDPSRPSCAVVTPRRTKMPTEPYRSLGELAGRTWFHVTRLDEPMNNALAALGDAGELVVTPVANGPRVDLATTGTRAWIAIKHEAGLATGSEELATAELTTLSPQIDRVESLRAKTTIGVDTFAIGETRALFYTKAAAGGLEYWDRFAHRSLAVLPHEPDETPLVRCVRDHCFAIGRFQNELQRVGFDANNRVVHTTLSAKTPSEIFAIGHGNRTAVIYALQREPGVFGLVIDETGTTVAGETVLVPTQAIEPQLFGHHLVWWRDGWYIATVSADLHIDTPRFLGLDGADLRVAESNDGALITAADTVDRPGQRPRALAIFIPRDGPPEPPVDIAFGDRSSGYVAFPIVAPGYAGAIVERMMSHEPGELVIVRAPCN